MVSWDPDQPFELNTKAEEEECDATHYSIELRGFSPAVVDPSAALAQAFSIELTKARSIASSLPRIITQHVSKDAGGSYLRILTQIGATASLLPEPLSGQHHIDATLNITHPEVGLGDVFTHGLPEIQETAQPVATDFSLPEIPEDMPLPDMPLPDFDAPPSQTSALPPARAPNSTGQDDYPGHPGFWNRMHLAPMVPLHGGGIIWLVALFVAAILMAFLVLVPVIGWITLPFAGLAYSGFMALYFGAATDAGSQDDGRSLPEISYDKPNQSSLLLLGFVTFLAAMLLIGPAVYLTLQGAHEGLVLLGSMLLYIYFPMGVAVMGLSNSPFQILNPLLVGRAMFAAGAPYFVVVMFGIIVNGGMTLVKGLIMSVALKLGGMGGLAIAGGLVAVMSGTLFCYTIGMQGFLLGCIFGDTPEAFEFLNE